MDPLSRNVPLLQPARDKLEDIEQPFGVDEYVMLRFSREEDFSGPDGESEGTVRGLDAEVRDSPTFASS